MFCKVAINTTYEKLALEGSKKMESEGRKCTKRQRIGVLLYRDGPSSFEDEKFLLGEKSKVRWHST